MNYYIKTIFFNVIVIIGEFISVKQARINNPRNHVHFIHKLNATWHCSN